MKRSEQTARTLRQQERAESRNFLLLLLVIVGVVALIQVLLFLTMTRIGTEPRSILHYGRTRAPVGITAGQV
ncbi:MAG: hypothetical protein JO332_05650 [Planctomycetaceae bacterium]|nr:hypothetical protein [Planctomycetaceae bacterium]